MLGPMLKSLHRGTKGGGPDTLAPPPGSALGPVFYYGDGQTVWWEGHEIGGQRSYILLHIAACRGLSHNANIFSCQDLP